MKIFKRPLVWIAIGLLVLPVLVRALWLYRGLPQTGEVRTPDYPAYLLPQPPLSTPLPSSGAATANRAVVLIDQLHGNQFQPHEIQPLIDALIGLGTRVEYLQGDPPLAYRLKYADAFAIFAPSAAFAASELTAIQEFVASGGRLLVVTDATRGLLTYDWFTGAQTYLPDANLVNPLLAPYGLSVANDYLYNLNDYEGNFRNVYFRSFGEDALTEGLGQVVLYGAHSITTNGGTPLLLGDRGTYSSLTDQGGQLAGMAIGGNGKVAAIGDLTFLSTAYSQVADNQVLIANLAEFLSGGTRTPTLRNYPFVFNSSQVAVIGTGSVQWNATILSPVAALQSAFRSAGIDLRIATEAGSGDQIILGTFENTEELAPYLASFGIDPAQATDSIDIPGFGPVGLSGNSLILYENNGDGARLILIASTTDDLVMLVGALGGSDLPYNCLIEDDLAVCSSGYGESFSDTYEGEEGTDEALTATPTPYALPTPTPVR